MKNKISTNIWYETEIMREKLRQLHYDATKMEMGHFIGYLDNLISMQKNSLNDL